MDSDFHLIGNQTLCMGVDFATSDNDFSVSTVMRKREDGVMEIVSSSIIGRGIPNDEFKKDVLSFADKHYENK